MFGAIPDPGGPVSIYGRELQTEYVAKRFFRKRIAMIGFIKRKLYPVASKLLSHAILVEGRLKGAEQSFRCLFVSNSRFTEYLKARIYEEVPVVLRRWRIFIPLLRNFLGKQRDAFDLCVAVIPKGYDPVFRALCDYKCTEFVQQIIDTSGSWEDVRSRFSKTRHQITNRFVEKTGLDYRISHDLQEFDHFYHRMFVPHIQKRYGDLSDIESYEEMKEFFLRGLLLFVTKGNEAVAGALCLVQDGTLVFRRAGVLDGDETHIKVGAQTALYYFQIRYAMDQHLHAVDTMASVSLLNDGVYLHKRGWGAAVYPYGGSHNWVYFFHAGPSQKIARFFADNPLIAHSDQGLAGIVGIADASSVSDETIQDLIRQYRAGGLHGFTVVTPGGTIKVS